MKCWRCKRDCPADSWPTLAHRIQSGSTGFGHRARSEQNMRKTGLDNQLVFLDRKRNLYVYKRKGGDSVVERAPSIFGFLAVVMLLAISRVFDHADLFEPSG